MMPRRKSVKSSISRCSFSLNDVYVLPYPETHRSANVMEVLPILYVAFAYAQTYVFILLILSVFEKAENTEIKLHILRTEKL